jgi:very-short-patch-repair endonuclease
MGAGRTKRAARRTGGEALHEMGSWEVCARLAGRRRGIVTRAELLGAGIHPDQIKRWRNRGLLHPLFHGVYAVGHTALVPLAREHAALLACGPKAILSHFTAAHLWGLRPSPPPTIDLTLVGGHCRPKRGVRIHLVSQLDRRDLRRREGLPLTSPARTIIELAAYVSFDELDRLVAEARANRLVRPGELQAALDRAKYRRGVARMRAFLADETEPDFTRSKGERRLLDLLRQSRLPQPRSNRRAAGYEVDFLWEAEKLVVEFDGYRFHGHRRAFEHDRRKDVDLASAGYQVLRFTWRQLTEEPLVVIAAIARALGRRGLVAA